MEGPVSQTKLHMQEVHQQPGSCFAPCNSAFTARPVLGFNQLKESVNMEGKNNLVMNCDLPFFRFLLLITQRTSQRVFAKSQITRAVDWSINEMNDQRARTLSISYMEVNSKN